MSDFGTGFATGFANSLAEGIKRNDQRSYEEKQDLMKLSYGYMMKQDEKRSEREAESQKNIRKAKALAKSLGAPEGAWPEIYEAVDSGMSDKQIDAMFSSGEWGDRVGANSEVSGSKSNLKAKLFGNAADDQSTAPAPNQQVNPVQAQTEQATGIGAVGNAGIQQAPQARTEQPTGKKFDKFGGLLSNASGKFKEVLTGPKVDPSQARKEAAGKFAAATGRTPEQVMQPYQADIPQSTHTFKRTPGSADYGSTESESKAISTMISAKAAYEKTGNAKAKEAYETAKNVVDAHRDQKVMLERDKIEYTNKILSGDVVSAWGTDGTYLGPLSSEEIEVRPDGTKVVAGTDQVIGRTRTKTTEEVKEAQDIETKLQKPFDELTKRQTASTDALNTFALMDSLVDPSQGGDPAVLQQVTSGAATKVDGFFKEVGAATNLIRNSLRSGDISKIDPAMLQGQVQSISQILQNPALGPTEELAAKAALFEAQKNVLAYQIGVAYGQEGRSLAEAERVMFSDMAAKGKNADTFRQNMANVLIPMINSVDREGKVIVENNAQVRGFKKRFGYNPEGAVPPEYKYRLANESDPTTANAYGTLSQYMNGSLSGNSVAERAKANQGGTNSKPQAKGPPVGTIVNGMRFKGGDPYQQSNWEKQ